VEAEVEAATGTQAAGAENAEAVVEVEAAAELKVAEAEADEAKTESKGVRG